MSTSCEQATTFEASIDAKLRSSAAGDVVLSQLALGVGPLLILVPDYDCEQDTYSYQLDATDLGNLEEVADTLDEVAFLLRAIAVERKQESTDPEVKVHIADS